jgi:hypothetical protein
MRRDWPGHLEVFFGEMFPEPHSAKQREDCVGWALETTAATPSPTATLSAPTSATGPASRSAWSPWAAPGRHDPLRRAAAAFPAARALVPGLGWCWWPGRGSTRLTTGRPTASSELTQGFPHVTQHVRQPVLSGEPGGSPECRPGLLVLAQPGQGAAVRRQCRG